MPTINAQVTAMIRNRVLEWLSQTCLIEVESTTTGEYGQPLHGWTVSAVDVPCRVILVGQRYGSGIAEAGSAETLKYEYRLIVGRTVILAADMRITVDGLVYNVVRIETALTDEAFHGAILQRRD